MSRQIVNELKIYIPVLLIDNHQASYNIGIQDFERINRKDTYGMATGAFGLCCSCVTLEDALSYAKVHYFGLSRELLSNRYQGSRFAVRVYEFKIFTYDTGTIETIRTGHYKYEVPTEIAYNLDALDDETTFIPVEAGSLIDENY